MPYCYIEVLLPLPINGTFTYAVDKEKNRIIIPGIRVVVPFGKKKLYTALVVKVQDLPPSDYEIKEIMEVLDENPVVLDSQLELWQWISQYYMCSEGEVYKASIPAHLHLNRKTRKKNDHYDSSNEPAILNSPQQKALEDIHAAFSESDVVLLHGVTSSGKTEIYIQLINEFLKKKQQVLYLLPEIALTTQIINRLRAVFGSSIAVYHSKYSSSERIKTWNKLLENEDQNGEGIKIILGVRSAVLLPFRNLGLIIIDEEHENTYKQFDPAPRYHARDTAIMLAKMQKAKVLLGTATPSIESYFNCLSGKFKLVELNERYLNLQLPEISVVNVRELRRRKQMKSEFSPQIIDSIEEALSNNEQVILFQNRRGFSLFIECTNCGEVPRCKNCDVSLTYHKKQNCLYCHYCGYKTPIPPACPSCHDKTLQKRGFGTEKIEEGIALLFPQAKVDRMDVDATRSRKSFEKLIARFESKQSHILVGTQMVSKGLDFDNVKLVGIMNADTMLNYPDFRAHERSYQLMAQVSGRSGRKNGRGKVIIQTSYDNHPVIADVVNNNYQELYKSQILERRNFAYPPFSRLVEITLKHRDIHVLDKSAAFLAELLQKSVTEKIMGPEYPLISKMHKLFLKRLLIKMTKGALMAQTKKNIVEGLTMMKSQPEFHSVQYTIDVDPY